jgi:hypothetical protein
MNIYNVIKINYKISYYTSVRMEIQVAFLRGNKKKLIIKMTNHLKRSIDVTTIITKSTLILFKKLNNNSSWFIHY